MVERGVELDSVENLSQFLLVVVEVAKEAGQIIKSVGSGGKTMSHKGKVDLMTQTDKHCKEIIFKCITKAFPSHKFIGEDTTTVDGTVDPLTNDPTWIVDPLDGTSNFVHNYPSFYVSIGLTIKKIFAVARVVFYPISKELITTVKGSGAFLNGQKIKVSNQQNLGETIIATELGVNRENEENGDFYYKVYTLQIVRSVALCLCGVAIGRLGGFYFLKYGGPWDVGADVLIVEEVGGQVFNPSRDVLNIMSHSVVASNGFLKKLLLEALVRNL